MTFLCKIGIHRWKPVETFHTKVVLNGKSLGWVVSWTGYWCDCAARKLKCHKSEHQSPGATQAAYDWLNAKPEAKATVLELVKR